MDEEPVPPPSLPAGAAIELRGWHTEDTDVARLFANRLMALTSDYSRWLDLSRLSRIILSYDYRAALAEVQGVGGQPNIATSNEFGDGAAMAVLTEVDGELKSVLVVWTPLIVRMFDEEDSLEKRISVQSYVHELVHVDDQAFLDKTYPGGASAMRQRDERHGALLGIVAPAHAEFSATSRTANMEPTTGFEFVGLLKKAILDVIADVRLQRRLYRVGTLKLEGFWFWIEERCRFIFQSLGYALGHAHGILESDDADEEIKERYRAAVGEIEGMELGWLVSETRSALRPLALQAQWTGLEVFDPLIGVAERLLNTFGVFTRLENDVLYVDIPLTGWNDF
ncbi:MAG: hypothetical protein ACK4SZ_03985 [Allosphingosinicella sp.]|uniref:hypothetical protein n=1 Tax=Allosphingosinicella sp. TaxID=2823234 RepID=UPI0039590193